MGYNWANVLGYELMNAIAKLGKYVELWYCAKIVQITKCFFTFHCPCGVWKKKAELLLSSCSCSVVYLAGLWWRESHYPCYPPAGQWIQMTRALAMYSYLTILVNSLGQIIIKKKCVFQVTWNFKIGMVDWKWFLFCKVFIWGQYENMVKQGNPHKSFRVGSEN